MPKFKFIHYSKVTVARSASKNNMRATTAEIFVGVGTARNNYVLYTAQFLLKSW
jgi:hypothetical protein